MVHVSGTKGKGSTCALTAALLQAHGQRTGFPRRVGLYTSPELVHKRERIRINGQPISPQAFADSVWHVWDALAAAGKADVFPLPESPQQAIAPPSHSPGPRILQLLFLTALHAFHVAGVDAAVIETHAGGGFDATNAVRCPVATGVAAIGMDHIAQLGPTLSHIAAHKAGIFKKNVPAFAAMPVDDTVTHVLQSRAEEVGTNLSLIGRDQEEALQQLVDPQTMATKLSEPAQRQNAALALALARSALQNMHQPGTTDVESELTQADVQSAISTCQWPGRFQQIQVNNQPFFLDGAHNELGVQVAARWFVRQLSLSTASSAESPVVAPDYTLIFAHTSETRDGLALMHALHKALASHENLPQTVIFTSYREFKDGFQRADKMMPSPEPHELEQTVTTYQASWSALHPASTVSKAGTIEEAMEIAASVGAPVFVTGSLHLVGGVLAVLDRIDTNKWRSD